MITCAADSACWAGNGGEGRKSGNKEISYDTIGSLLHEN